MGVEKELKEKQCQVLTQSQTELLTINNIL